MKNKVIPVFLERDRWLKLERRTKWYQLKRKNTIKRKLAELDVDLHDLIEQFILKQ